MISEEMPQPLKINGIQQLLNKYSTFLFDLDGVVWKADQPIQSAKQALQLLAQSGKNVYFITNSSVKNREQVQAKIANFQINTGIENIYTSSYISSLYMKNKYPQIEEVAVIGSISLVEELKKVGLRVRHIRPLPPECSVEDINTMVYSSVQAVIMGFDNELNYRQICLVSLYLQKGAKFIGTNPDKATKIGSYLLPGAGSQIKCVEDASRVHAQIVGKPNHFTIEYIVGKDGIHKKNCLMIGDNLETDIEFARASGIDSLCVLTGVTSEQMVLSSPIRATYYSQFLL